MKLVIYLFIALICFSYSIEAKELDEYGAQCRDIGFKPKTPAYGDCVLELRKRDRQGNLSSSTKNNYTPAVNETKIQGDGTPDDVTCRQYGFNIGTEQYSQCRLQLNLAKRQFEAQQTQYDQQQQQYEIQRKQYEAQIAAIEKEKERQKSLKLMEFGLRMAGGQSPRDASMATAGMLPIIPQAPARPVFENYSVTMPGGRTTNCTYNTTMRSMHCN